VTGDDDAPVGSDAAPADGRYPVGGTALLKTAALASVPAARLPELLTRVQADLGPRIDDHRRKYERVVAEPDREAFLVDPDYWEAAAGRLNLDDRERDAVARAHETAVERAGSDAGRRAEFETALEIRSAVVIGTEESNIKTGESNEAV